jgi:hypothetical protein
MSPAPCVFPCLNTHADADVHTEENMTRTFADFAKGFWDKPARASKPRPTTLKYTAKGDPEALRYRVQLAGIIQELVEVPSASDTDRRVLNISRAVAFLPEGR